MVEYWVKEVYSFERTITAQKMKFSIKDFFSNCEQIRRLLRIWSHLLKKFLMENFIFCTVYIALKCSFLKNLILECAKFHGDQWNISYNKTQGLFCSKFSGTKFAPKLIRTLLPCNSVNYKLLKYGIDCTKNFNYTI